MEELFFLLRILHIVCGSLALIAGTLSIINNKGSRFHRITGIIFVYALLIVAVSAIVITQIPGHSNLFLLIIGVFAAYLAGSGYRALFLKQLNPLPQPKKIDWAISGIMAVFAVYFVLYGVKVFFINKNSMGLVAIIFALIAISLVYGDYKTFTTPPSEKYFWLFRHLIRMIAGVIATYTAFLVVNNKFLPPLVAWLAPTVIGTAVIFGFIRYYNSKFSSGEKVRDILIIRI